MPSTSTQAFTAGAAAIAIGLTFAFPRPGSGADPVTQPQLIREFFPGEEGYEPVHYAPRETITFFIAPSQGQPALWRSDGTPEGTFAVGPAPRRIEGTAINFAIEFGADAILFYTPRFDLKRDLWFSDGSQAGTQPLVSGIGSDSGGGEYISGPDLLVFRGADEAAGSELWVSDGTAAGTHLLKDLTPGPGSSRPFSFTALAEKVLFTAGSPSGLWATDGTAAGTFKLPGPAPILGRLGESAVLLLGFESDRWALWRTDGSPGGTVRLKALPPGLITGPFRSGESRGYFLLDLEDGGRELWTTDGTAAGTRALSEFPDEDPYPFPRGQAIVGNRLVFQAWTAAHGADYWISDGTVSGTKPLDLCPGPCSAASHPWVAGVEEYAVMIVDDGVHGAELWRTDGTQAGTGMIVDACPGQCEGHAYSPHRLGPYLLFVANDGAHGEELWWSTGEPGNAARLTAFQPPSPFGGAASGAVLGKRFVFDADDGVHGTELWSVALNTQPCVPGPETLCLQGGRFQVEATFRTPTRAGKANVVPLTSESGYLWFFRPDNIELIVKVINACSGYKTFWVFSAGLTNVEVDLKVTDTATGLKKTYRNPLDRPYPPRFDTNAFETCSATNGK